MKMWTVHVGMWEWEGLGIGYWKPSPHRTSHLRHFQACGKYMVQPPRSS